MSETLDLAPAIKQLLLLALSDGDLGREYWDSVIRLLRGAHLLQGRIDELQAELALLKAPRPQVLMSLNMLRAVAEDVFETAADADAWLRLPHPMLDHAPPRHVAKTLAGRQRVLEILVAIKYGLPV